MAHGRWYPTVTTLGDGRVMTFSGLDETGATNTTVEIYTARLWLESGVSRWLDPASVSPDAPAPGRARLLLGLRDRLAVLQPLNEDVVGCRRHDAIRRHAHLRHVGAAAVDCRQTDTSPRVMIFGGGNPATNTTEIIDLSAATPQWQYGPPMSQPRIEMNATILPDGKVLAMGGSLNDEDAATASLKADLYDPIANTFSSGRCQCVSPSLPLCVTACSPMRPLMLVGGNPTRGCYESPHRNLRAGLPVYGGRHCGRHGRVITSVTPGQRAATARRSRCRPPMLPTSRR